ncbi:MAG TPA: cation diffusion facilitator family transporter [Xanthobacteraceae bacterium]
MVHIHTHQHEGPHVHGPAPFGRAFAIASFMNAALVAAQVVYGVLAHSVALLADAGHNFGDVLGLLLAWGAYAMSSSVPTKRYTYGLQSASILAALLNSLILLVATGAIAWQAILRIYNPSEVAGVTVMAVAAIGILVNGASAFLLSAGRKHDLNIRAASLHLLGDAAISLGVVVTGGIIALTSWYWIDPAASLIISALIVWGTWRVLREAAMLSLAAVPEDVDPSKVRDYLGALDGVSEVHDLHIWAMSTTEVALTAHLVRPGAGLDDELLKQAADELAERFKIRHVTLQIEAGNSEQACRLAPDSVI